MWRSLLIVAVAHALAVPYAKSEQVVDVADDASLRAAIRQAQPGTRIRIAPGRYQPGIGVGNLQGKPDQPVIFEGADKDSVPLFEGGSTAWHLSDCAWVVLRDIAVRGQSGNGINIDDGGSYDTPSHHITLERIHVADVGPTGNRDGIKLSGVDDFLVRDCTVEGWGGQAVDMVGCHRGRIERCRFRGKEGFSQTTGPQTKGGSSQITICDCFFENAGQRAVNIGGSTGLEFFRPLGALYEARDIVVEGCTFVGSMAPVSFVGVDGASVRYNTIWRPERWVVRILQETREKGFVPSRNGRFEHNLVVFRRSDLSTVVNVGSETNPESFQFAANLWFCEDQPGQSKPLLPTPEERGVYGVDPRLTDPGRHDFRPRTSAATGLGASAWRPRTSLTQ